MTKSEYESTYNDPTTGTFRDGQAQGSITEADMRQLVSDTSDNSVFWEDQVLDEDSLVSDSDTHVPTQQSVKTYVDTSISASINAATFKANCRTASTGSLTLSGEQTIDGVACVSGDRILAKNQSTNSQNGIYVVAAGAWSRSTDADTAGEINGAAVYISEGTVNATTRWQQVSTVSSLGSDPVIWQSLATVLDEDDMISDSPIKVPSQQSTKAYVDRLNWKAYCKAATTANITLSGEQTIDSIPCVSGDHVLVKNQVTAANNGIYVVASGAWTRRTDADTSTKLSFAIVHVSTGTVNRKTTWAEQGTGYSFTEFQKPLVSTNSTTDASSITFDMKNKAYQRFQLNTDESTISVSFSNYDVGSTADLFITKLISGDVTLKVMTDTMLVSQANGSGFNLITLSGADASLHHIRFYFMGTASQISAIASTGDSLVENIHVNSRTKAWFVTVEAAGKIRRSVDGGVNWTTEKTAATPLADIHFDSTGTYGIAAGGNSATAVTVSISTDGGDNWTDKTISGISASYLIGACICEDSNTYLVAGANAEVWKTTNQGTSWSNVTPGGSSQITDLFRLSANTYYAAGFNGYLYKTTNGGSSWTDISTAAISGSNIYGVSFVDANTGFIACQGSGTYEGIWKTTDGGTTWTRMITSDWEEVWALNSTIIFAATSLLTISYSLDGGTTWNASGAAGAAVWGSSIDNILSVQYSGGVVSKFFSNHMNTVYEYGA